MITCASCATDNRAGTRFCDGCGSKLAPICSHCSTENRPGARFCDQCGRSLTTSTTSLAPTSPPPAESLMPAELAEKLRNAEVSAPGGERRVITVLFCDVKGSTAAAEHLDPERWQDIINGAFEHMIEPVYRYEGFVARLMGDGLLAFFGAPIAHEDDPERAVLAALEIVERIDGYKRDAAPDYELAVRVGINTGLVMVGRVGTDQKDEYTAMGNAVNVAARMEQTATPGTVQVAEPTYRATIRRFEWQPLGPADLKGQSEPVETYRPLRALANVVTTTRTELVGRAEQLHDLEETLERLDAGTGSVVLLIGEAGLGKSRLIAEARESHPDLAWIQATATSYESEVAFAFIRRLASALYAQTWTPFSSAEIREPADRVTLEHLISPRPGDADPSGFSESLTGALSRMVALCPGPLVVACDGLEWADDASLNVLDGLSRAATDEAITLLCAYRPDSRPSLQAFQASLQKAAPQLLNIISVEPLPDHEVARLLAQIAPEIDPDRRSRLVPRLGGNPLFAEELTRSLDGGRFDQGDLEVPDSLLALLVAKLDRLGENARRAAQLASILGEDFTGRLLEAMGGGAEIPELLRSQVLVEASPSPERRLAFRHGLMRDAAYSTVLRRDRLNYHRLAAEAIERVHGDDLDGSAELLARQFRLAGDSRAIRYEVVAGRRAQALSATAQAIELLERAHHGFVQDATALALDDAIALHVSLGRAYELAGRPVDAREIYHELLTWGRKAGERRAELAALPRLGLIHSRTSPLVDPPVGWEYTQQGIALADDLGDTAETARLSWVSGHLEDDSAAKAAHFERALDLLRTVDEPELTAFVLNDLYQPYAHTGRVDEAVAALDEARTLWEGLGNRAMRADSLTGLGLMAEVGGDLDRAETYYSEGGEIGAEIGSAWLQEVSLIQRAGVDVLRGDFSRWWEAMAPYASRESFGLPSSFASQPLTRGFLALGRHGDLLKLADSLEPVAAGVFAPWWADLYAIRAVALQALGEPEAADQAYGRARELDDEWAAPLISQTPFRMSLYRVRKAIGVGDWADAEAAVARYETRMRPIRARLELARAAAMRATIADARGDGSADSYLAAAQLFETISPWFRAEMMWGYGMAAGDQAAIDDARNVAATCLQGLPTHLLDEVDTVPWLRRLLA